MRRARRAAGLPSRCLTRPPNIGLAVRLRRRRDREPGSPSSPGPAAAPHRIVKGARVAIQPSGGLGTQPLSLLSMGVRARPAHRGVFLVLPPTIRVRMGPAKASSRTYPAVIGPSRASTPPLTPISAITTENSPRATSAVPARSLPRGPIPARRATHHPVAILVRAVITRKCDHDADHRRESSQIHGHSEEQEERGREQVLLRARRDRRGCRRKETHPSNYMILD